MQSELAQQMRLASARRIPTGRDIAPLLRGAARLIPYTCRYLVHADQDYRFIAADALFRISRQNRGLIARHLDLILRGLKFQDGKTRTKILLAIAPVVREYPTHIERYLATISHCLYNPDNPALRLAASVCLANLAAVDDRRGGLYIPMLLHCIAKFRGNPETWKVIRTLSLPLRQESTRRYHRRIRETILPFRNRGVFRQRTAVRRVLALTAR